MALDLSSLSDVGALLRAQDEGNGLRRVGLDSISPDPNQPRKSFDEESLAELAESIHAIGIIQPPVVRSCENGYLLISGERRWRAACRIGLKTIDVIVRDDLNARAQLIENIQREALSHWEIYRVISAELAAGMKHAELARSLGKSRTWVTTYAAVDNMPPAIVSALQEGRVTGITALTHLHRLHGEMPSVAAELLTGSKPVSRSMIERARGEVCSAPAVEHCVSSSSLPPGEKNDNESLPLTLAKSSRKVPTENSIPTKRTSPRMPVRILAFHEETTWIVDYRFQREIGGIASVRLDGGERGLRFAPLEALRLQLIEWL